MSFKKASGNDPRPFEGQGRTCANSLISGLFRDRENHHFTFTAIPQSLIANLNKIANITRFTGKSDRQKPLNTAILVSKCADTSATVKRTFARQRQR